LLRLKHMNFRYYRSKGFFSLFLFWYSFFSCHSHATNFRRLTHAHGKLYSWVCGSFFFILGLTLPMRRVCLLLLLFFLFFFLFFLKIKYKN
jgi:hypothetical protein